MAFAVTDVTLMLRADVPDPDPCPMCGEPLTPLLDGGSECEVNGCVPCPLCEQGEATGGGVYPCARCRLGDDFDA